MKSNKEQIEKWDIVHIESNDPTCDIEALVVDIVRMHFNVNVYIRWVRNNVSRKTLYRFPIRDWENKTTKLHKCTRSKATEEKVLKICRRYD